MTDLNEKNIEQTDIFCKELPTKPLSQIGRILVAGASGYIGGRLVPELIARGYHLRVMVRGDAREYNNIWPDTEVVVADALDEEQLKKALLGIDTAYYLIHSLHLGLKEFEAADIRAAANFCKAAEHCEIKRIIYLGGLGDIRSPLSSHLRNRIEVAMELAKGKVPVTILRAAIIIGSGSASYEIIHHLVKKLPVIIVPQSSHNQCQPISIRDIIKYLVGTLEVLETTGRSFDIGGQDILSYKDMLETVAQIIKRKTWIIPSSFTWMRIYSYFVSLLTPVPNAITQCLLKGLKNEVICQNDSIKKYLPFEPISYRESIIRAMTLEEQDRVRTRWSDAYPPAHELSLKFHEIQGEITYSAKDSLLTDKSASSIFRSLCRIGGKEGWFHATWMWRMRGMVDRILMGVGTSRGRKRQSHLEINDVLDFWRIEDISRDSRLLLRAEMKLPGKAWLEFRIRPEFDQRKLIIIAYFYTEGFFGRLYWYIFMPFHHFIFKHLIEEIEKRS